jgi:hypothetical protein
MTPLSSATTDNWLEVAKAQSICIELPSNYCIATSPYIPLIETAQTTPAGLEIPVPTTGQFFADLTTAIGKKSSVMPSKSTKRAAVLADEILAAVANAGTAPDNSPRPTNDTAGKVIGLVGAVTPDSLLGDPDVDTLNGEINLTWNDGTKQIILICVSGQEPLIHHHEHVKGKASQHGIEKATAKRLAHWLGWLHE